jgi:isopenicillin N synthase-like dioxygenase
MGLEKSLDHPDCKAQRMLTGPNVWPPSLEPGFSHVMNDYFQLMCNLQDQIMRMIAQTLDVDYRDSFEPYCLDSLRGLRLLHYPPQRLETDLGAGAHTDFGALTILLTDGVAGLQILDGDANWVNVHTIPGAYVSVCLLGRTMERN